MELLILIVVIAVVALATMGLVVGSAVRRRPRRAVGRGGRSDTDLSPGVGDDAEVPRDAPTRTIDDVGLPAAPETAPPRADASGPPVIGDVATAGPAENLAPSVPPQQRPPAEMPAPAAGRLVRLRLRLSRSQNALGRGLLSLLSGDNLDEETWEDVEATLLLADVGVVATGELVAALRERTKVLGASTPAQARAMLRDELLAQVGTATDRSLRTSVPDRPAVVLVVGVNGTGKTTTCGKVARLLVAEGRTVVLGAADTFRAAAADQLQTWG
ncbi:signal recognition particle receptor subunit alpha, partial [Frankia sp. AvcI1]